jgi:hypothetical protein
MILIVSEKPIAGKRIAEILSDGKLESSFVKRAVFFVFEKEKKRVYNGSIEGAYYRTGF